MRKVLTRYKSIPIEKMCHIEYYVRATPFDTPHSQYEPPFIVKNKFFETQEEAEALKEKCIKNRDFIWCKLSICEKITEIE